MATNKLTNSQMNQVVQHFVVGYLNTGDNELAGEAFEILMENVWTHKLRKTAQLIKGTTADAKSLYGIQFMKALQGYDASKGVPFVHYVNRTITNDTWKAGMKATKIAKVENSLETMSRDSEDGEGDFNDILRTPGEVAIEDKVAEMSVAEKQAAQKEILADIMSKATEKEITVLIAYAETGSYREVQKATGVAKSTAARIMERIQEYYDYKKFGDIQQYFTTNTQSSRGGK